MARVTQLLIVVAALGAPCSAEETNAGTSMTDREVHDALWEASLKVMKQHFFVRHAEKTRGRIVAESPIRVAMLDKSRQKIESRILRDDDFYWDLEVRVTNQVDTSLPTHLARHQPRYVWRAVGFDHDMEAKLVNEIKQQAFGEIKSLKDSNFMPVGSPKGKVYPTGRIIIPGKSSQGAPANPAATYEPPKAPSHLIIIMLPNRSPRKDVIPFMVRGEREFREGKYDAAAATFREALMTDPHPAVKFALGHSLFATGDYAFATATLREGIQAYPSCTNAKMDARRFYGSIKDFEAHRTRLAAWITDHPDDRQARFLMGYLLYFSGDVEGARRAFEPLLKANQKDPEARSFWSQLESRPQATPAAGKPAVVHTAGP